MSYEHFNLPGWVAKVEGDIVVVEHDGESLFAIAASDTKALTSIITRAAVSVGKDTVKVIGKPREKKAK